MVSDPARSNTSSVTFTETDVAESLGEINTNFPPPGVSRRDWYVPVTIS
jgi:hypothetical protein